MAHVSLHRRRLRHDENGAEITEIALILPLFLLVLLASMQLAMVAMTRYEVKHMTREAARFLAINPDTTDAQLLASVDGSLLPGMASASVISLAATPACPSLSGGHCSGRDSGSAVSVAMVYDASPIVFLPSGFLGFTLGSKQIGASVSIAVE